MIKGKTQQKRRLLEGEARSRIEPRTVSIREEVLTDLRRVRRGRKERRETNAMTRRILDKILWLRLQKQLTHLAL